MTTLSKNLLRTPAGRAAVAYAYSVDGFSQSQIARVFGYKNARTVYEAIDRFLFHYDREAHASNSSMVRKSALHNALIDYLRNRGEQLPVSIASPLSSLVGNRWGVG